MPGDKPDVGFQYGVEGDQALLSTIKALRDELKNVQNQQERTASSAETMARAWRGLVELAGAMKLAEFAREVFDTAVSLGKLSQITGVSTKTLSVYYKAAADVGVAHEQVDKGVIKLARSFVQLEAGKKDAAVGFGLLNLHAKDFIGLSPDEKLRKVTEAFAGLKSSGEKAAAAQALFSKGGAALIPVLNQLGREGFKEVSDQAERLGLIFDQDMVDGAIRTKAAIEDLKGAAEGATAQFEAGFLPALADTADALTHNVSGQAVNGFKFLGQEAGKALKDIIYFLTLIALDGAATAQQLVEIFGFAWSEIGGGAEKLWFSFKQAATGDFAGAIETLRQGSRDAVNEYKDAVGRIHAIREAERAAAAKTHEDLFSPKERKPAKGGDQDPGNITGANLEKGLDRAEEAALKQKAQDELTLYRDLTRQKNEADKREYEQGLISLEEYFNRRKAAIKGEFIEELKALGSEKLSLQGLLTKTEGENAVTPQQEIQKKRDILDLQRQIAHVDAQIADETVKRDIEDDKNETERFKAKQDHLLKELEAQKKLAELEGNRAKAVQLANQIEDLQLRKELQQLGQTEAEINRFLAQFGAARSVRAGGEAAKQDFGGELSSFEAKKAAIQASGANGPLSGGISELQENRQLIALYQQEIPLLEQKVEKLRQQAALAQAGSDLQKQLTKEAEDETVKIQKLRLEMAKLTSQWKTDIQNAVTQTSHIVTTGFNGWIQGQEKFGQAAKKVWNSIVMTAIESIERIAAKWIEQHILMAAISKVMSLFGGGGNKQNTKKLAAATGDIQIDAATAAADVFAQAIAKIPFPANLAAAPALAATTEAQVMAFQAQAVSGAAAGASGGMFAAGGLVRKNFTDGGSVSGPGGTDVIPAWLTAGEHVITTEGVKNVGVRTLDMINSGALRGASLPAIRHPAPYSSTGFGRYASGGLELAHAGGGGRTSAPTIHNHNTIQSSSIDSKDFRGHIDDHMDYISDSLKARMRNFRF